MFYRRKEKNKNMDSSNIIVPQPTGRLTANKLLDWVRQEFKKLGLTDYEVTEISRTHYSQDYYEAGASRLIVTFRNKAMDQNSFMSLNHFLCYYRISDYDWYLKNGYELYLKDTERYGIIKNFTIEVRKKI
jgi:hypothetical protein